MTQHFLLSAKARTLSIVQVARMTEEQARATFQAIRWADNDGQPYCPKCGCAACYGFKSRPIWKCKACGSQFSVTSGTIFASHKLPLRDYLLAIAFFVNGAKGLSAMQLSRDLDCQYKTAFVHFDGCYLKILIVQFLNVHLGETRINWKNPHIKTSLIVKANVLAC